MPRETIGAVLGPREHQRVVDVAACEQLRASSAAFSCCGTGYTACVMPVGGRRGPLDVDRSPDCCSISRASSAIGGGIVALKNSVCRLRRHVAQDAADVREKSHVEHPVGFVEHQDTRGRRASRTAPGNDRAGARACRR